MIVTTILDIPYTMLRETPLSNLTGNDRYEGYVVDLLDEISKMLSNSNRLYVAMVFIYKSLIDRL